MIRNSATPPTVLHSTIPQSSSLGRRGLGRLTTSDNNPGQAMSSSSNLDCPEVAQSGRPDLMSISRPGIPSVTHSRIQHAHLIHSAFSYSKDIVSHHQQHRKESYPRPNWPHSLIISSKHILLRTQRSFVPICKAACSARTLRRPTVRLHWITQCSHVPTLSQRSHERLQLLNGSYVHMYQRTHRACMSRDEESVQCKHTPDTNNLYLPQSHTPMWKRQCGGFTTLLQLPPARPPTIFFCLGSVPSNHHITSCVLQLHLASWRAF